MTIHSLHDLNLKHQRKSKRGREKGVFFLSENTTLGINNASQFLHVFPRFISIPAIVIDKTIVGKHVAY